MTSEEITAHHEAGHAVMGLSLGYPIESVTIVKHEDNEGKATFLHASKMGWRQRVLIANAGWMAQRRASEEGLWGCSEDFERVEEAANVMFEESDYSMSVEQVNLTMQALDNISQRRLDENWPAVERMAAALLERKRLTGNEAKAIFEGRDLEERKAA